MPPPSDHPLPAHRLPTRPLWLLYTCTALIVLTLVGGLAAAVLNLRETTLRSAETNLTTISLTLAEQADRAVQGVDLVLGSLVDFLGVEGVTDEDSYRRLMETRAVHQVLKEKLVGLPYINAITMIDAQGNLINFSRYWPIPKVNIADRDYFRAMLADDGLDRFISEPVENRGDGVRTFYLARRVRGSNGQFAGLVLGAIELRYFQEFYRSVLVGEGSAVSLMRQDGVLLARYPVTSAVGRSFPVGGRALQTESGTVRDLSPVDGQMRIKAARKLQNYRLFVLATVTEAAALTEWRRVVWVLGLITAGCVAAIVIAALAIGRWSRQQHALGQERAERAEAERARALAEADLMRERERHADEANRAKSGFLAVMSHEIRTPMNAVLGLAGTLLDGSLTPPQRRIVEAIRDSGDNLLRILNDILDFSKLGAGRMTLEPAPFSPATLTQNVVSILGPRAAAKGLAIVAENEPTLPPGLMGDAGRIRQVLLNLMSNAVKFTETGSVSIRAGCLSEADGHATIEWTVSDTGIGIPAEQVDKLFNEFTQADSSISRRFGGSGLGLAISRRVVDQMGGKIGVTSRPGAGTTFRVVLTLPVAEPPVLVPPEQADTAEALRKDIAALGRPLRVLFAEDNPTNQFVALQLLKGFDIQIDVAGDGVEAVDAAARFAYDVICMDVRMPEMDGLEATRLIRKRGGILGSIPIIALTANAFPEDVQACFAAGMTAFVPKPVSKDVLVGAILRAVSGERAPPAAGPPMPDTNVPDLLKCKQINAPAVDVGGLRQLRADLGPDGAAELLAVFLHETEARLQRLADAALSPAVLQREVHTLKGAAGTVFAARLAALAAVAEQRLKAGGQMTSDELAALAAAFSEFRTQPETRELCEATA